MLNKVSPPGGSVRASHFVTRIAILFILSSFSLLCGAPPAQTVKTFTLREEFGVTHPKQVVTLDLAGTNVSPTQMYMLGPDNKEVAYQLLTNGRLAIQADLPAGATRTWSMVKGRSQAKLPSMVVLSVQPTYYEIVNGLTGVRIVRPEGALNTRLAPIQGVQMRNGQWSATGPNYLSYWQQSNLLPLTMVAQIVEKGPLQVTIQVAYTYNRPDFYSGPQLLIPKGSGYYRSTITIQAGLPSIRIEEDTDLDLRYDLNVYDAVQPDQGRYRGWGSRSVECGHEADGQQYRPWTDRAQMDAFRDLTYSVPMESGYACITWQDGAGVHKMIPRMWAWNPWTTDTGPYWMLYNKTADPNGQVAGFFIGPASIAVGAQGSGPGVYTSPASSATGGKPAAGVSLQTNRRSADNRVYPRVRLAWGIFVGTKGADLGPPDQIQNINVQMNLYSSVNLDKVARYQTDYPDPPKTQLYMTNDAIQRLIQKVRTDNTYYSSLSWSDPNSIPLLDVWRDSSKTTALVQGISSSAQDLLNRLVNQNGIFDFPIHYWMGGAIMSRWAIFINDLLTNETLSAADRQRLKAITVLFANVLWDEDFVPLTGFGVNMLSPGTGNMYLQEYGYRQLYTLMLATHPMMSGRVSAVQNQVATQLDGQIADSGAHMGSPHYVMAAMGPLVSVLQQLKVIGIDLFGTQPKLAEFAEFYMNMLTPPEVRFANLRKLVSIGDGSTESSDVFGQMATALADVNPSLSRRLMGAWVEDGKMENAFAGTTVVKIDDTLPRDPLNLRSASFPGYASILRSGFGTPNETATWFINGTYYSDHRHQDGGAVAIYALGAPMSIDWGSMYTPQTPGAYMHSSVIPESLIGQPWNADNVPLTAGWDVWPTANVNSFEAFGLSTHAVGAFQSKDGTSWRRAVYSIQANPAYPVIVLSDSFGGTSAGAGKVLTLNMMAQGPVQSTVGTFNPVLRTYAWSQQELPSGGTPAYLSAGVNNFRFTGQWLIDWDLYTASSQTQQAIIGNWAHGWHPNPEMDQFKQTNGRPFEERQHIFRLRSDGGFTVLLLPYKKGQRRAAQQVTQNGSSIVITATGENMTFNEQYYAYSNTQQVVLTSYGAGAVSGNGVQISGGPTEVVLSGGRAAITAHGAPGIRRIQIPGKWNVVSPLTSDNGVLVLDYRGGDPFRVELTQAF